MSYFRTACILFFAIIVFPLSISGEPSSIVIDFNGMPDPKGIPQGWELKEKKGNAEFRILNEGQDKVLCCRSVSSSFSFQREITVNLKDYPYLQWSWKAERLPEGGDFRKAKTNDQALQTLIAFKDGKILSYIWDTNAPLESVMDESIGWPVSLEIKVLAARSGGSQLGQWVTITRNVYDDYKKLFGAEPPPVKGIRAQINSQHTGTAAEGCFGKMTFKK